MENDVISFIFRANNFQILSWGLKRINPREEIVDFPLVLRKVSVKRFWRDCQVEMLANPAGQKMESRTGFRDMVRIFNGGSQRKKAGIDFMLTTILYEIVAVVRRVVEAEMEDETKIFKLWRKISTLQVYIRFYYCFHIGMDEDPLNYVKWAIMDWKRNHLVHNHMVG